MNPTKTTALVIMLASIVPFTAFAVDLPSPPIAIDSTGLEDATLGGPRHGTCAATDGTYGYVFGGQSSPGVDSNIVFRHDPRDHTVIQATPAMPLATHMCAAAWYNGSAYVFGGYNGANLDTIIRWTPGKSAIVTGHMVAAASHHAASVDPSTGRAYVIGGYANGTLLARIQVVDLTGGDDTRVTSVVDAPPRAGAAAVWDPRPVPCPAGCVYIIGGDNGTAFSDTVLRFEPVSGITAESARLPSGLTRLAATFDGRLIHAYGGQLPSSRSTNGTLAIEPITGSVYNSTPLPKNVSHVSAVWISNTSFIYGGSDGGTFFPDIAWHKPLALV